MVSTFEINENCKSSVEFLEDTEIHYLDDFYKNPQEVVDFILSTKATYHKQQFPGYNSEYFHDMRYEISTDVSHVYGFLSKLCNQKPAESQGGDEFVIANYMSFCDYPFNDYQNNYWWPHVDFGWTALVYLSDDEESGTNLYRCLEESENQDRANTHEHLHPWRPKRYYELVKSIKPRYNRCVMFNGGDYLHGQNITNKKYFGNVFRLNQVLFFEHEQR